MLSYFCPWLARTINPTLLQGMARGAVPFELWSGGRCFWDHLAASPRHATTFDGAMRACNHTGAKMAVEQYPWNRWGWVTAWEAAPT